MHTYAEMRATPHKIISYSRITPQSKANYNTPADFSQRMYQMQSSDQKQKMLSPNCQYEECIADKLKGLQSYILNEKEKSTISYNYEVIKKITEINKSLRLPNESTHTSYNQNSSQSQMPKLEKIIDANYKGILNLDVSSQFRSIIQAIPFKENSMNDLKTLEESLDKIIQYTHSSYKAATSIIAEYSRQPDYNATVLSKEAQIQNSSRNYTLTFNERLLPNLLQLSNSIKDITSQWNNLKETQHLYLRYSSQGDYKIAQIYSQDLTTRSDKLTSLFQSANHYISQCIQNPSPYAQYIEMLLLENKKLKEETEQFSSTQKLAFSPPNQMYLKAVPYTNRTNESIIYNRDVQQYLDKIKDLENKIEQNKEISLNVDKNTISSQFDAVFNSISQNYDSALTRIANYCIKVESIGRRLSIINDCYKSKIEEKNSAIQSLKAVNNNLKAQLLNYSKSYENEITELKKKIEAHLKIIENNNGKQSAYEKKQIEENAKNNQLLLQKEKQIKSMQQTIHQKENEIYNASQTNLQLQEKVDNYMSSINSMQRDQSSVICRLQAELEIAKQSSDRQLSCNSQLSQRYTSQHETVSSLQAQLTLCQEEIGNLNHQIEEGLNFKSTLSKMLQKTTALSSSELINIIEDLIKNTNGNETTKKELSLQLEKANENLNKVLESELKVIKLVDSKYKLKAGSDITSILYLKVKEALTNRKIIVGPSQNSNFPAIANIVADYAINCVEEELTKKLNENQTTNSSNLHKARQMHLNDLESNNSKTPSPVKPHNIIRKFAMTYSVNIFETRKLSLKTNIILYSGITLKQAPDTSSTTLISKYEQEKQVYVKEYNAKLELKNASIDILQTENTNLTNKTNQLTKAINKLSSDISTKDALLLQERSEGKIKYDLLLKQLDSHNPIFAEINELLVKNNSEFQSVANSIITEITTHQNIKTEIATAYCKDEIKKLVNLIKELK